MPMIYTGQVDSTMLKGEAKLAIEENGVSMSTLFDACHISYSELISFSERNYQLCMITEKETILVSRLGNTQKAFYEELYKAYNNKVRKALFVKGNSLLEAQGEYRYLEVDGAVEGTARIEVYDNCLLILPPDDKGRRVPFCFVNGMHREDFKLTLELDTGESYSFLRLGYLTEPFADCINKCLFRLRGNSIRAVRELDSSLTQSQEQRIARLMPEGVAVPLSTLSEVAPSYIQAVEAGINNSRISEEYKVFSAIGSPLKLCVGMKSYLAGEDKENLLWLICSGSKPGVAAVELALSEESAAATFLYEGFEDWEDFRKRLSQAMEAIDFKREVIRLTEEELRRPEYADYVMAIKRNKSLRFIRRYFAGRIIHSSPEHWEQELLRFMKE